MQQFDICRLRETGDQFVVVLQDDLSDELTTRVVAPLSDRPYRRLVTRLRLEVEVGGNPYVLMLDRLAAIERRMLGSTVGSVKAEEYRIKSGLDLLFFGV